MTRFENRTTVINGLIIDIERMEKSEFSIEQPYVRSIARAEEMVKVYFSPEYDFENNQNIVVKITELVNEKPKPVKYNDGKIRELAYNIFDDEVKAREYAEIDGSIVRVVNSYAIDGQVWFLTDEGEYGTQWHADETPMNLTKVDQRAFLKMSFEDTETDYKVLGLHNVKKHEIKQFCLITAEKLSLCIDKD